LTSAIHEERRQDFEKKLPCLFDIAHENAMEMMKIQEDRDFLVCQRQEGRPGAMAGVDRQLACVEEKIRIRADAVEKQKQKAVSEIQEAS